MAACLGHRPRPGTQPAARARPVVRARPAVLALARRVTPAHRGLHRVVVVARDLAPTPLATALAVYVLVNATRGTEQEVQRLLAQIQARPQDDLISTFGILEEQQEEVAELNRRTVTLAVAGGAALALLALCAGLVAACYPATAATTATTATTTTTTTTISLTASTAATISAVVLAAVTTTTMSSFINIIISSSIISSIIISGFAGVCSAS
ncbi:uncharacterized protein LOC144737753 [Lampetra planeri]